MLTNNNIIARQRRQRCRPILSCILCRERKVKCDRESPCRNCVRLKRDCVYPSASSRIDTFQSGDTRVLQPFRDCSHYADRSDHLSLSRQDGVTGEENNQAQSPSTDYGFCYSVLGADITQQDRADLSDALENTTSMQTLAQLSPVSQPAPVMKTSPNITKQQQIATNHISPPRNTFIMNKTRMFGRSHWMNLAFQLSFMDTFLRSDSPVELDLAPEIPESMLMEIRLLFRQCKLLARATKSSRLHKHFLPPQTTLIRPSREIADSLIVLYLSKFESVFRIVHRPSFESEYATFWDDRAPFNETLQHKVYLVMAIGSSLYRNDPVDVAVRLEAKEWIYSAHNWTAGPLEKSRLSIDGLQIQCLLVLACQALSIGKDLVWITLGTLVRCAMQMGLHRDPSHFESMSALDSELRRRLWATIMELNVQASLDSGMPPIQSFECFDTRHPANLNDEDLNKPDTASSRHGEDDLTDTSVQIILFGSLRTRLDMLSALNGFGTEIPVHSMLAWSSQIVDTCGQLHRVFRGCQKRPVVAFQLRLAIYLLRRFILPLSGLVVKLPDTDSSKYYAKKICFDSVLAIMPSPQEGDYHLLMQIGGGMFIRGFHYAVLALSLELQADVFKRENDTTCRNQNSYQELFLSLFKDAQALTTERLTFGETNVKWEVLVSMIIGQIDAAVCNTSVKLGIAKAAKDSLKHCVQILRVRAASSQGLRDTWDSEPQAIYHDNVFPSIPPVCPPSNFPAMNFFSTSPDIWPPV